MGPQNGSQMFTPGHCHQESEHLLPNTTNPNPKADHSYGWNCSDVRPGGWKMSTHPTKWNKSKGMRQHTHHVGVSSTSSNDLRHLLSVYCHTSVDWHLALMFLMTSAAMTNNNLQSRQLHMWQWNLKLCNNRLGRWCWYYICLAVVSTITGWVKNEQFHKYSILL